MFTYKRRNSFAKGWKLPTNCSSLILLYKYLILSITRVPAYMTVLHQFNPGENTKRKCSFVYSSKSGYNENFVFVAMHSTLIAVVNLREIYVSCYLMSVTHNVNAIRFCCCVVEKVSVIVNWRATFFRATKDNKWNIHT